MRDRVCLVHQVLIFSISCIMICIIGTMSPANGGTVAETKMVAAGAFAEACAPLTPGQEFSYSFNASHPVYFDIHYHDAEDSKYYPVQKEGITRDQGYVIAEVETVYCMMWVNRDKGPVNITFQYHAPDKGKE